MKEKAMNYKDVRAANEALNKLAIVAEFVFRDDWHPAPMRPEVRFSTIDNPNFKLSERQTALFLRALYDDAAATLQALGVQP